MTSTVVRPATRTCVLCGGPKGAQGQGHGTMGCFSFFRSEIKRLTEQRDEATDIANMTRAQLTEANTIARTYLDSYSGGCGNPDVPGTCEQTPGEPLCPWCTFRLAIEGPLT